MVTIIPRTPTLGDLLGQSTGEGLMQGMQGSMQQMQQAQIQQKQGMALSQSLGISPQEGMLISSLPPEVQKAVIQQSLSRKILGEGENKPSNIPVPTEGVAQKPQVSMGDSQIEDLHRRATAAAAAGNSPLATQLESKAKMLEKRVESKKTREFGLIKDYVTKVNESVSNVANKRTALNTLTNAFKTGNLGMLSPDYLAEITGIEGFRSQKGAEAIAAGKEFFLGNLSRIKAKGVNQWIERQLKEMQPMIGRSKAANLGTSAILENEIELQDKEGDVLEKYLDQADNGLISYRKIPRLVSKEMDQFATENEKKLVGKLKRIEREYGKPGKEQTKKSLQLMGNEVLMRDPNGSLRAVKRNELKKAQAAGYTLQK